MSDENKKPLVGCICLTAYLSNQNSVKYQECVSVTIGNPVFCLTLYLTGILFRGELQHVGDVSQQKIKCRPIRTREIGGVRLSE